MRELERRVVLSVIDRRWRDHLYEMDYLKDGIGLRAMAQRDPLVEYQREGFALFQQMMGQIREETVGFLFNLEVEVNTPAGRGRRARRAGQGPRDGNAAAEKLSYTAPSDSGGVEVRNQRGQIEQAATARAKKAEAESAPSRPRSPVERRLRRRPGGLRPAGSEAARMPGPQAKRAGERARPRTTAPTAASRARRSTPPPIDLSKRPSTAASARQRTLMALARQRLSRPSRRMATARWCAPCRAR